MTKNYLFTSESVSEGHPDKIADQISDAILDEILKQDLTAKVACETYVKTGFVIVGGEISTKAWVDVEQITRQVINNIGYTSSDIGFDGDSCGILNAIGKQSPDISIGVNKIDKQEQGAGDQGIMFGYATDETDTLMPAPIFYAHKLMQQQAKLRKSGKLNFLRPDAKSQVTFKYENNIPTEIETVLISTQHTNGISENVLKELIIEEIIKTTIPKKFLKNTKFLVNPTGRFVIGGPQGDCGLTGRKIIVDTYGGMARHGGGCFSGKDPSKVDRSGAYVCRYIAKNIVAAKLAKKCEVQLSYAIGIKNPTSLYINTFGTSTIDETRLCEIVKQIFPLTPYEIISQLDLLRPIYLPTASYGHFGRDDLDLSWEKTDKIDLLNEKI